jgi:AraC-like DNA-binding protein
MRRLNDALQVFVGTMESKDVDVIQKAFDTFERRCPEPRTTAERLVVRGALLDAFLRLETTLADCTTTEQRCAARGQLHAAGPLPTITAFLTPARRLVSAANRVSDLPPHERVRQWICEHPDDRRSIHEIATLHGTHSRTLHRHFVKFVGKTVQEYRWECRAKRAEALLDDGRLKVDDVAHAIGARSKSTVYRVLRRYGGRFGTRGHHRGDE